jgi:hypothetical protein
LETLLAYLIPAAHMTINYPAIEIAAFGAFLQELFYWYDARTKLFQAKYKAILASPGYWLFAAAMIFASGVGTWIWFDPDPQKPRTYLLMGAAFPVIFKKLVTAFISKNTKLGATVAGGGSKAKDYFAAS